MSPQRHHSGNQSSYLSDDSDFYGDERTAKRFQHQIQDLTPSALQKTRQAVQESINSVSIRVKRKRKYAEFQEQDTEAVNKVDVNHDLQNPYEGVPTARQLNESIDEFLQRVDPVTYSYDRHDSDKEREHQHYAWVANFQTAGSKRIDAEEDNDRHAEFVKKGNALLEIFRSSKQQFEKANQGKAESTIKRKMLPIRDKLKTDILSLAKACDITSGKWLLFPKESLVRSTWAKVVRSVSSGTLGPVAKIHLRVDEKDRPLYVYTVDFSDLEDVKRVVLQLRELGFLPEEGRWIYYKCDAYTHLGIMSGNEYGLDASLYASGRLLEEIDKGVPRIHKSG